MSDRFGEGFLVYQNLFLIVVKNYSYKSPRPPLLREVGGLINGLEEPFYLTGLDIHVNPSEGRVRTRSWHQTDGSCTGT
jgi:hypothetical protein